MSTITKTEPIICSLCNGSAQLFYQESTQEYFRCVICDGIQLHPNYFVSLDEEQERYMLHENDIEDIGYQNFVKPIVDAVTSDFQNDAIGLDFGCGTGPVITRLLNDKGYEVALYDPFFKPADEVLNTNYNFIVCCEVIEHFYNPRKEFQLLGRLLKPQGKIYCKTAIFETHIDFKNWWYKDDPTHVFFYTKKTLAYISQNFGFSTVAIQPKHILFSK